MACFGQDDGPGAADGTCPACGEATEEGLALIRCSYSPLECQVCDWSPCDGSC